MRNFCEDLKQQWCQNDNKVCCQCDTYYRGQGSVLSLYVQKYCSPTVFPHKGFVPNSAIYYFFWDRFLWGGIWGFLKRSLSLITTYKERVCTNFHDIFRRFIYTLKSSIPKGTFVFGMDRSWRNSTGFVPISK